MKQLVKELAPALVALMACSLGARDSLALPSFGSSVDSYCTSNAREPATPYAGDCSLCHNPINPGLDQTPLFQSFKSGDFDAFCPPSVNLPPEWQPMTDPSLSEDGLLQFSVVASDPEGDTLLLEALDLPTGAAFEDRGDGTGQLIWMPTFDQAGDYPVTFKATDSGSPAESALASITIHVGDLNRSPVLAAIGNRTVEAGSALSVSLVATDPDGDSLEFGSAGLPETASITDTAPGAAQLEWMPTSADVGSHPVTISVTDSGVPMQSDAEEIVITVTDPVVTINRPPQLDPMGDRAISEGEFFEIALGATDPDGDLLTFDCTGVPAGTVLEDRGDGSGFLRGTAGYDQAGNYPVTCSVVDSGDPQETDSDSFVLTIGDVNRPPTLDPLSMIRDGDMIRVPLTAQDPDGDAIAFSVDPMPAGSELVDAGEGSAEFVWIPAPETTGSVDLACTATDDGNPPESTSREIRITLESDPGTTTLSLKARWSGRRHVLGVSGDGAPANAIVEILDADTGAVLGDAVATRRGTFRVRLSLDTEPCSIRAMAEGQQSDPTSVRGACTAASATGDAGLIDGTSYDDSEVEVEVEVEEDKYEAEEEEEDD